jgi:hypothetical protein
MPVTVQIVAAAVALFVLGWYVVAGHGSAWFIAGLLAITVGTYGAAHDGFEPHALAFDAGQFLAWFGGALLVLAMACSPFIIARVYRRARAVTVHGAARAMGAAAGAVESKAKSLGRSFKDGYRSH